MAYYRSKKRLNILSQEQTGSIVTFNSQYAGLPLKSHKIALTATQSGSGTPSPQNIRSINGYSEININACGVNLWNGEYTPNTWISETSTGATAPHTGTGVTDYVPIIGGTSYYKFETGSSRASFFDKNKNCIGGGIPSEAGVITTPANAYYVRFTVTDEKISSFGLNYPSTDTDYHAYNGTTTTITIGSTVYGGEYDARTGVLTVTHKGVLWSDLTVQQYNGHIYRANVSNILRPTSGPERQQGIMSSNIKVCSTVAINETMEDLSMLKLTDYVYIMISSASTATEARAILGSGQLVYELATPQTIQLPPCPIDTLQGENNLFASTGETTAEYIKIQP